MVALVLVLAAIALLAIHFLGDEKPLDFNYGGIG